LIFNFDRGLCQEDYFSLAGAFFYEFISQREYRILGKSAIPGVEDAMNIQNDAITSQIDAIN
jgi:hypothetical protein